MKVGSIVECINNKNINPSYLSVGMIVPKLNIPYTVRALYPEVEGIYLEEITNPKGVQYPELGYFIYRFRELQLPRELEQILNQELQLK